MTADTAPTMILPAHGRLPTGPDWFTPTTPVSEPAAERAQADYTQLHDQFDDVSTEDLRRLLEAMRKKL